MKSAISHSEKQIPKETLEKLTRIINMGTLSENWMTEHLMDFEYKKYVLLGYLKQVKEHFNEQKLYPDFAELIAHYKNLIQLRNNTNNLENNFKKNLKGMDFKNMQLVYDNTMDDELLDELKQIIQFSEPLLAKEIHKGRDIFDFAEKHIAVNHVGILPIYKDEGYFILLPHQSKQVFVYNYSFSKVNLLQQEVYGLNSTYFSTYTLSLSKQVDKIKHEIIEINPQLPNPAVYLFKAKTALPNNETFLPISKRLLYKHVISKEGRA